MDWKAFAIDKLKQYEPMKQSLKSIPIEIAQIDLSMTGIRSATVDGTPVKGGGNGRENMLLNCIVRKEELQRCLENAQLWVDEVTTALKVLNDEERLILDRFYIVPAKGNIDRLCGELCVEQTTVYKRKDAALRRFTIALYGCTES